MVIQVEQRDIPRNLCQERVTPTHTYLPYTSLSSSLFFHPGVYRDGFTFLTGSSVLWAWLVADMTHSINNACKKKESPLVQESHNATYSVTYPFLYSRRIIFLVQTSIYFSIFYLSFPRQHGGGGPRSTEHFQMSKNHYPFHSFLMELLILYYCFFFYIRVEEYDNF